MKVRLTLIVWLGWCSAFAQSNNSIFGYGDGSGHNSSCQMVGYAINNSIFGFGNGSGHNNSCQTVGYAINNPIWGYGNGSGHNNSCQTVGYAINNPIWGHGNGSGHNNSCQIVGYAINNSIWGYGDGSGYDNSCQTFGYAINNSIWGYGDGSGAHLDCNSSLLPLPVNMLYFKASLLSDHVVNITWSTANEINLDKYIIQRSYTNMNDWQTISQVKAGSSFNAGQYSIEDKSVLSGGDIYYRIIPMDRDGKQNTILYSVVHVNETKYAILYNNPVTDKLNVQVVNATQQSTKVQLYTLQGVVVIEQAVNGSALTINTAHLQPACYVLVVYADGEIIGRYKIIKE